MFVRHCQRCFLTFSATRASCINCRQTYASALRLSRADASDSVPKGYLVRLPTLAATSCFSLAPKLRISSLIPARRAVLNLRSYDHGGGEGLVDLVREVPQCLLVWELDGDLGFRLYHVDETTGDIRASRLPNVYRDAKICWGNLRQPEDLRTAFQQFFGSPFNQDLTDRDIVTHWRPISYGGDPLFSEGESRPVDGQTCMICGLCTCHSCPCTVSAYRTDWSTLGLFNSLLRIESGRLVDKTSVMGTKRVVAKGRADAFFYSGHKLITGLLPPHLLKENSTLDEKAAVGPANQQADGTWIVRFGEDFLALWNPTTEEFRPLRRRRVRRQLRHLETPLIPA